MFINDEDGPDVPVAPMIMVAIVICVVLVAGGGLVPQWFVEPALRAITSF
jgi:hypothetical protein